MNEPNISVAILIANEIEFILDGYFTISGADRVYNGKYNVFVDNDNIIIKQGEHLLNVENEISFNPHEYDSDSFVIKNVVIGKEFHWEQKENQRFQGTLKIINDNKKISIINVIPLEDYLKSVISSEMSSTANIEFLKTHSIISRSWVLAQIEKKNKSKSISSKSDKISKDDEIFVWYDKDDHQLFDVCADDHCQRYQGITKIQNKNVVRAIKATYGLVLTQNNEICDTRFSKCCGGISESFENVWQNEKYEYLSSIVDYKFPPDDFNMDFSKEKNAIKWIKAAPKSFCNCTSAKILNQVLVNYDQKTTDFYRWEIKYTQAELKDIITKKSGIDFGDILDIIPISRGYSGRLIKIMIVGSNKTMTIGKELEIRRILAEKHLYSSAFVVEKYFEDENKKIPAEFKFFGAGWGHGVGLCQIGAAVMGDNGHKFDEILNHYFKNAAIKKIY